MGIRNKISSGYIYYLTLTVEEWIDVFSRPAYKHIIIDSLNYCIINKGLEVYCWCLMSNHLHLIARAKEDGNLSDILRDFKKFTSKTLIAAIKEIPESRRDWMLNLFWYAGKNNKKIKYFKICWDSCLSFLTKEFMFILYFQLHIQTVRLILKYQKQTGPFFLLEWRWPTFLP